MANGGGSVYGWGFSVEVPQTGEMAHRTRVYRAIDGFGNAYLLTGDRKYIDAWTRMIDIVNSNSKMIDGVRRYPYMYGDDGWYDFQPNPVPWGLLNCWFWTQDERDEARVKDDPWVKYLSGSDPEFPERELGKDFNIIREKVAGMRADTTTPDTRLADDPMAFNPATVQTLNKLMMAGLDPGRGSAPLHCRLRYFDPINRRAGIPDDVAALIDGVSDDEVSVTLVNLSQTDSKELIVQAGAYGEHQVVDVRHGEERVKVNSPRFVVRLEPGCGTNLVIFNERYSRATNDELSMESEALNYSS